MKTKPKARPAGIRAAAIDRARETSDGAKYRYPIKRPELMPGVVPQREESSRSSDGRARGRML
jgi:hypothetical protein